MATGRPEVLLERSGTRNAGRGEMLSVNGRIVEVEHVTEVVSVPLSRMQSGNMDQVDREVAAGIADRLARLLVESGLIHIERMENHSMGAIDYRGVVFVERGVIVSGSPAAATSPPSAIGIATTDIPAQSSANSTSTNEPEKKPSFESLLEDEGAEEHED